MPPNPRAALLRARLGRFPQLDPQAVLAVAAQEGLGGGVGDQGTSFGPFQLHRGGALPSGVANPHQWAWSPAGIDYALSRINSVAGGQRGGQAVRSIVSKFERPADPSGEIARALGGLGQGGGGGGSSLALAAAPDSRKMFAQALLGAIDQHGQLSNPSALAQALAMRRQAPIMNPGGPMIQQNSGGPATTGGGSLGFLSPLANQFGLKITSTNEGNHVPGSYHYRNRAEDFSGDPRHEAALQQYAIQHPQQFVEAFYTGPGAAPFYVKNGRVFPVSQLDRSVAANHRDHVHLAR